MTKIYVRPVNKDQDVKLSDGREGYLHIERENHSYRYVFKFSVHAHHSFWYEGVQLPNGLEVEVHTIDGPERYKILVG